MHTVTCGIISSSVGKAIGPCCERTRCLRERRPRKTFIVSLARLIDACWDDDEFAAADGSGLPSPVLLLIRCHSWSLLAPKKWCESLGAQSEKLGWQPAERQKWRQTALGTDEQVTKKMQIKCQLIESVVLVVVRRKEQVRGEQDTF